MMELVSSLTGRGSAPPAQDRLLSRTGTPAERLERRSGEDRVEISEAGQRYVESETPASTARLDRIRSLIQSGQYLTPARVEGAIDGLLDDLKN